jgi:hypothetical protein
MTPLRALNLAFSERSFPKAALERNRTEARLSTGFVRFSSVTNRYNSPPRFVDFRDALDEVLAEADDRDVSRFIDFKVMILRHSPDLLL